MKLESVFLKVFLIILVGGSSTALGVQRVEASGTIYIRADGSIDPPTAPISTVDNSTYAFADNINDSIVVERDNTVIDGAGHTLYIDRMWYVGIDLAGRTNVTVRNAQITNAAFLGLAGIGLNSSSNNSIIGNNITNNRGYGIVLHSSSNNSIIGNNITANHSFGICLDSSSRNRISENNITNNDYEGICLGWSSSNSICGNNIAHNGEGGIWLYCSFSNSIIGNNITANNEYGIRLEHSSTNSVIGNNIAKSEYGISFYGDSSGNRFYHNHFIDNSQQVRVYPYANVWDDGYPSGGNYWSNYNGTDSDQDGIGDTPYVIDVNSTDNYPLMGMFYCSAMIWQEKLYAVNIISNSTVSRIGHVVQTLSQWPNHTIIEESFESIFFYVSGEDGTYGFCRVDIPVDLLNATYRVFVNRTEVPCNLLPCSNSTHSYLYFNYTHSKQEVTVIPEFPSFLIPPLFFLATLLAVITYRRKRR